MPKVCKVTINAETIYANRGDLLLDAALTNGIELPHDCRSGYCDTCQVRVVAGRCVGDAIGDGQVVHACQTRVISDLSVVVEKTPRATEATGRVVRVVEIASGVFEICIEPSRPLNSLPGPISIGAISRLSFAVLQPDEAARLAERSRSSSLSRAPVAKRACIVGARTKNSKWSSGEAHGPVRVGLFPAQTSRTLCPYFERNRLRPDLGHRGSCDKGKSTAQSRSHRRSARPQFPLHDSGAVQDCVVSGRHNCTNGIDAPGDYGRRPLW